MIRQSRRFHWMTNLYNLKFGDDYLENNIVNNYVNNRLVSLLQEFDINDLATNKIKLDVENRL